MGLFTDTRPSPHELTELRLMKAGAPSDWKRTRHKWLLGAGLVVGFWAGSHLSPATPAACTTPSPSASGHHASGTAPPAAIRP